MYLPSGRDQLTMVGVAGYPTPFHEIEIGVGIIGRAAASQQTQFVPDVLADPDYRAARDDVRSGVAAPIVHSGELLGVVNFEGTIGSPIGPAQVALAEMVVHALSAALRSARLDDERRDRLHAIERVLAVSRSLVADLDRPRIVASIVDDRRRAARADVVALFSRGADGAYRLEAGLLPRTGRWGWRSNGHTGIVGRAVAERVRDRRARRRPSSLARRRTSPIGRVARRRTRRWPCRSRSAATSRRSCSLPGRRGRGYSGSRASASPTC